MTRLGDAYDEAADAWSRRRLYFGAALLFLGAVLAAPGLVGVTVGMLEAVGVGSETALVLGIAVAALAVPVGGASLLRWIPAGARIRTGGATGVVLSAVAVGAFIIQVPPGGVTGPESVSTLVAAGYLLGALLAIGSPIVAAGLAANDRPRRTSRPSTTFVRERRTVQPRARVPADGGEDEEQLAFLLDQDDQ